MLRLMQWWFCSFFMRFVCDFVDNYQKYTITTILYPLTLGRLNSLLHLCVKNKPTVSNKRPFACWEDLFFFIFKRLPKTVTLRHTYTHAHFHQVTKDHHRTKLRQPASKQHIVAVYTTAVHCHPLHHIPWSSALHHITSQESVHLGS